MRVLVFTVALLTIAPGVVAGPLDEEPVPDLSALETPPEGMEVEWVASSLQHIIYSSAPENRTDEVIDFLQGIPEEILALFCVKGMPVAFSSAPDLIDQASDAAAHTLRTTVHLVVDQGISKILPELEVWTKGIIVKGGTCEYSSPIWGTDAVWVLDGSQSPNIGELERWFKYQPPPNWS